MQSMTGYGRGTAELGRSEISVEIRTVNHRFLDLRLHVPPELASEAAAVEDCVRQYAARGRVDVTARVAGPPLAAIALDQVRAEAAFDALRQLRDRVAPSEQLPLGILANVPGLFREAEGADAEQRSRACRSATELACRQLEAMRNAEGARLATDLRERVQRITNELTAIAQGLPGIVEVQREKLRGRIASLLASVEVPLDAGRLEHEIALLADRADVSEELTRLHAHAEAVDQLLTSAREPVGHRIDFLLQEMAREANTASAKLPDARATQSLLHIKAELLRMREQVQNVL